MRKVLPDFCEQCYCGDSYEGSGGAPASDSSCDMPCAGDSSSTCGASWLLSLYTYNQTGLASCDPISASPVTPVSSNTTESGNSTVSVSASSTAVMSPVPTIATATTKTSTITAVSVTAPATTTSAAVHEDMLDASEWYSLGCAVDSSTRVLTGYSETSVASLTIDECLSLCEDKGYAFAGVEYGQECYCGSSVPTTITYSDTLCTSPCTGDSTETCGGGWGLDLYELISSANSTSCDAPSTTTELSVGNELTIPTSTIKSSNSSNATNSMPVIESSTIATSASASAQTSAAAEPTSAPSSADTHNVWAHHMVGNTYPYAESDWLSDIQAASSYGIDGFALNMGSDSWQPARIADAYAAAASSGTGFKLFLSLDMTSLSCSSSSDAVELVSMVKTYATNAGQAMHNGKVLVSTFAGSDCTFGTGSSNGWQTAFVDALTSDGVNIFFVPSLFSDISTFSSNSWMDGELNWNSGWPMSDSDLTTASDVSYLSALGDKEYMPAISPFFYTHFGADSWNKNWLYRSDDWLYCTRWEQIIAMRENVKMTEILTWNDYGESSYIGPIAGALPAGSDAWVDGFDHEKINVLTKYYATAFKTGTYPTITDDTLILWSRPHPRDATATADSVGKPTGFDWTDDNLYAVVLAKSDATVTLTSGSSSESFSVSAGLTKLKMASAVGSISAQMTRSGSVVASYSAGSAFSYTDSPTTYNYNYLVGSSS